MLYINLRASGLKSDCSRLKNHFPAAYQTKNMFLHITNYVDLHYVYQVHQYVCGCLHITF